MNKDKSEIVFFSICLTFFILFIAINFFHMNYVSVSFLVLGISLVYLYYTKKKLWSLVFGSIVILLYIAGMLSDIIGFGKDILRSIIFVAMGIVMILTYYKTKSPSYATFGSFVMFAGFFVFVEHYDDVALTCASAFFSIIGTSFLFSYIITKGKANILNVVVSILLMIIAIFCLLGGSYYGLKYIYPFSIMCIGLGIFIYRIIKRN